MKRKPIFLVVAALFLLVYPVPSGADLLYLTSDHVSGGAGVPPFGQVELVQVGANVDFTVTLFGGKFGDSQFVRTGAGDDMDFKFNGFDIVLGDISGTGLTAEYGNFNGDGGGMFHYGVYFTGQGTGGDDKLPGPIVFTVANATIDDFIGPKAVSQNGTGQVFVADIWSGQTKKTGLVDATGTSVPPIPEPATMLLFGSGLIGMAGVIKRRFRKQ